MQVPSLAQELPHAMREAKKGRENRRVQGLWSVFPVSYPSLLPIISNDLYLLQHQQSQVFFLEAENPLMA